MNDKATIIDRLQHMENGFKADDLMYEAEVCFRAAEMIETGMTAYSDLLVNSVKEINDIETKLANAKRGLTKYYKLYGVEIKRSKKAEAKLAEKDAFIGRISCLEVPLDVWVKQLEARLAWADADRLEFLERALEAEAKLADEKRLHETTQGRLLNATIDESKLTKRIAELEKNLAFLSNHVRQFNITRSSDDAMLVWQETFRAVLEKSDG